jgi:hypothetical protein
MKCNMNRLITIMLMSILLFLVSCEKEKIIKEEDNNELIITMGTTCGWCAGGDSLFISENKIYYKYNSPCDDKDYWKDTLTNKNEWNNLIRHLDYNEFQKININTCYVCADGCDTWIYIKNGSAFHKIRFGYEDSIVIKNIKPFVDRLDSIRLRFRK